MTDQDTEARESSKTPDVRTTEQRNPESAEIDAFTSAQIVELMNAEDAKVISAVQAEADNIARAVDAVAGAFKKDFRLRR